MAQTFPLPFFIIYAEELLSDEDFMLWTATERGIWITLIARCWREGSIPSDQKTLAGWCNMDTKDFTKHFVNVSMKFSVVLNDTRMVSPRLEEERAKALARVEKLSKRGKAASSKRWAKSPKPDA
jgi:uncharacterized protein YdaU (DUF1376 family)